VVWLVGKVLDHIPVKEQTLFAHIIADMLFQGTKKGLGIRVILCLAFIKSGGQKLRRYLLKGRREKNTDESIIPIRTVTCKETSNT